MLDNYEILWTDHFHERLMERFGLVLTPTHKLEIEEMIRNNEIFCTLKNRQDFANVYGVIIDGQEVMVLFRPKLKTVVTAYRLNWLQKDGDRWIKNRPQVKPQRKTSRSKLLKPKLKIREFKDKIFLDQIEIELYNEV